MVFLNRFLILILMIEKLTNWTLGNLKILIKYFIMQYYMIQLTLKIIQNVSFATTCYEIVDNEKVVNNPYKLSNINS